MADKAWIADLTFPDLPRGVRQLRLRNLSAPSMKLAATRAVQEAMSRVGHVCGRRPKRLVLFLEAADCDYDDSDALPEPEPAKPPPKLARGSGPQFCPRCSSKGQVYFGHRINGLYVRYRKCLNPACRITFRSKETRCEPLAIITKSCNLASA